MCGKDLLKRERRQGKCILISTHMLGDLWELADQLVFLRDGLAHCVPARDVPGMGTDIGIFERSVAACLEAATAIPERIGS